MPTLNKRFMTIFISLKSDSTHQIILSLIPSLLVNLALVIVLLFLFLLLLHLHWEKNVTAASGFECIQLVLHMKYVFRFPVTFLSVTCIIHLEYESYISFILLLVTYCTISKQRHYNEYKSIGYQFMTGKPQKVWVHWRKSNQISGVVNEISDLTFFYSPYNGVE